MFLALFLFLLSGALAAALLPGCGKDKSPGPDTTPPAAVTDLTLLRTTETSATVAWTGPGDDGGEGRVASYDLRYSLTALPAGWDSATVVQSLAIPRQAGLAETATVAGLSRDCIYYLALRSLDDAGNESDLSNIIQAEPADHVPPGQVTDLRATVVEAKAVTLRFTAPGDDVYEGTAVAYELRYGPNPVTEESWEESTSFPIIHPPRPRGTNETVWVTGLTPEATLHFALRARDDGSLVGPVSNDVEVTLPADTVPPAAIQDLAVAGTGPYTVSLTWTAPGDDGTEGQANSYEVRYATAAITDGTWSEATPVSVALAPKRAWEREELTLRGLPGAQIFWFCVRASDGKGNQGGVSNVAKGYVYPVPRTWLIRPDGTGDAPTVQAGIDSSAMLGDTVLVAPGRYYEDIDFLGKGVVLKSLLGPEATILDGSREDSSVVMFFRDEPSSAVLEGFTITRGRGTGSDLDGGGIWCQTGSPRILGNTVVGNLAGWGGGVSVGTSATRVTRTPIFEGNRILDNTARLGGGGVLVSGDSPRFTGNEIRGNRALHADGGGLDILINRSGSCVLERNIIADNVAWDKGGGAFVALQRSSGAGEVTIEGNLFLRNAAQGLDILDDGSGGGLYIENGAGSIVRNTIVGNTGHETGPCSGGGITIQNSTGALVVEFNIIAGNVDCGIACRGNFWPQMGPNILWGNTLNNINPACGSLCPDCMEADPLFCDPENGDYRVAANSPALIDSHDVFGAFATAGCANVSVTKSTWGQIEARYR